MKAPWPLRLISQRPRRTKGRSEVVFEFTIEDRFTDAMVRADAMVAELGWADRIAAERVAGIAHVEALVDALGHGLGLDPRVWQSERREHRVARMRAERRAWFGERQAPSHPEFIGRRS